jgi:hypothetical protein
MAGPKQSPSFRSGMDEKRRERERTGTIAGTVGRDVPDESKERHTEIAVEAGRKGGARVDEKPQPDTDRHDQSRQQRGRKAMTGETVGHDVPDESKERHTEIAVEAGQREGPRRDNKS